MKTDPSLFATFRHHVLSPCNHGTHLTAITGRVHMFFLLDQHDLASIGAVHIFCAMGQDDEATTSTAHILNVLGQKGQTINGAAVQCRN